MLPSEQREQSGEEETEKNTDRYIGNVQSREAGADGRTVLGGGGGGGGQRGGMEGVGGEIEWRGGDREEHILIGNVQNGGRSVLGLDEDVCVGGGVGGSGEKTEEHRQIHW